MLSIYRDDMDKVIWEEFDAIRPDEVGKLLKTVSSILSVLDPCSSWWAKAYWEVSYNLAIALINTSLREGGSTVSEGGSGLPLPQEMLDPVVLGNVWPVFNHPFGGKVVEKIVQQLQPSLEEVDYLNPFQPLFKSEMALITPLDDFWQEWEGVACCPCSFWPLRSFQPSIMVSFWTGCMGGTELCSLSSFLQAWFAVDRGEEV